MTGGLEIYLDKYDQIMRTVILIHFRVMAFGWVEHPRTRDITCNPENGNQITFNSAKCIILHIHEQYINIDFWIQFKVGHISGKKATLLKSILIGNLM